MVRSIHRSIRRRSIRRKSNKKGGFHHWNTPGEILIHTKQTKRRNHK